MVDEVKGGDGLRLIADVGDGDRVAPRDGQVVGTLFVGDSIRPVSGDEVHAGQCLARFVVYHASLHASLCQGRGGGAEQKEEGEQIKLRSSFCHTILLLQLIFSGRKSTPATARGSSLIIAVYAALQGMQTPLFSLSMGRKPGEGRKKALPAERVRSSPSHRQG